MANLVIDFIIALFIIWLFGACFGPVTVLDNDDRTCQIFSEALFECHEKEKE